MPRHQHCAHQHHYQMTRLYLCCTGACTCMQGRWAHSTGLSFVTRTRMGASWRSARDSQSLPWGSCTVTPWKSSHGGQPLRQRGSQCLQYCLLRKFNMCYLPTRRCAWASSGISSGPHSCCDVHGFFNNRHNVQAICCITEDLVEIAACML